MNRRLIHLKQPLLLVGESHTRSHTIALCIMRCSFANLWSTSILHHSPLTKTSLKIKLACISRSAGPGSVQDEVDELLVQLELNPDHRFTFKTGIDACQLDTVLMQNPSMPTSNIWFQCPWTSSNSIDNLGPLIISFLISASKVQKPTDTIYLGLILGYTPSGGGPPFESRYQMKQLLRCAKNLGYSFFQDKEMIQRCIQRGYRHTSCHPNDIHDRTKRHQATLVFIKNKPT